MRARPIRPNVYLPVVRFGVADSDWFSVLLISCAGYLLPIPFGITLFYVPLQMWTWLILTAGAIAFFNYIRIGKRPRWLPHKLKVLIRHHRQYPALPNGNKRPFNRRWIIDPPDAELNRDATDSRITSIFFLNQQNDFQESEETWNPVLPMTN